VGGRTYTPRGHCYYMRQRLEGVRAGTALIAGDAAGLATVDLGEGIGPAIRSGVLAADAIAGGGDYSLRSIPRRSLGMMTGEGVRAIFSANKKRR
jgi:flavin-dependent dehydrogenase